MNKNHFKRTFIKSKKYIKKAADRGNKEAIHLFAQMLEEGNEVPDNKEKASKY